MALHFLFREGLAANNLNDYYFIYRTGRPTPAHSLPLSLSSYSANPQILIKSSNPIY